MNPVILIPEKIAVCGIDLLRPRYEIVTDPSALSRADAIIVRLFKVGADELTRAPKLKVIAKHGVGVDNIDVKAATARKIPVVFTPAANANGVAEHAMALMLAMVRHIGPLANVTREGKWAERSKFDGVELSAKTLGVVGLGRIGSRVAQIARDGFGMRVLGFDPFVKRETYQGAATIVDSMDELFRAADFLTFHVPLSGETRHLLNVTTLASLKPTCRIVNTSRGAVIDESALAYALSRNVIAGAALDVFEAEPLPADHPLCRAPNCLLTPHVSSSTRESLDRMAIDSAQGVLDVLEGRRPQYPVNPEVLP